MRGEAAYLRAEGRASFERPYGLAWLLQLGAELKEWNDPQAQEMAANLHPLEEAVLEHLNTWLPKLANPVRIGEHDQTAFAMGLMLDYARAKGDSKFATLVESKARQFFLTDKDCPLNYEPSGEDFLSPCLGEADRCGGCCPDMISEPGSKLFCHKSPLLQASLGSSPQFRPTPVTRNLRTSMDSTSAVPGCWKELRRDFPRTTNDCSPSSRRPTLIAVPVWQPLPANTMKAVTGWEALRSTWLRGVASPGSRTESLLHPGTATLPAFFGVRFPCLLPLRATREAAPTIHIAAESLSPC